MSEPRTMAEAAARARVMAAALALGRGLDLWSLALIALALATLLWLSMPLPPRIFLFASLFAGGAQKIFALRVAFDSTLFRRWAETWAAAADRNANGAAQAADLAALDHAIAACGLRAPTGDTVRDLESRLRGASKLLQRQAVFLALQFVAMTGAVLALCLDRVG